MARLAEYHAHRDELLAFYSGLGGAQRVNADQDVHTVFETLEALIVNPLPNCAAPEGHGFPAASRDSEAPDEFPSQDESDQ